MEQERDFFMLLLVEGSTGGERKEFLGGEGQKEFAPEEMEHIQVWTLSIIFTRSERTKPPPSLLDSVATSGDGGETR